MKVKQLSVFVENQPGRLAAVAKALGDAGINILAMTIAETREFGVIRMIVPDWQKGMKVLQKAGFTVTTTEILAIEVPDRPGGLAEVMKVSLATFRHLELGKGRKPQKRTLQKLAGVIAEVETKAAAHAPAESIKALEMPKPVAAKATVGKVVAFKPEKHIVRPARIAEEPVELAPRVRRPVEITNLDLELINRILRLSDREKLELLQKLL